MELEQRARAILQIVVEAYVDDAQPVSSAAVSRRGSALALSPATIRSAMADLEAAGLLLQPHTSAGRVPTEKGLRVYLDGLMSPKLHPWDRTRLDAAAGTTDPADFPAQLGQSLAGLAGQLAIVAVPRLLGSRFREVGLLRVGPGRFLAYFVSPGGLVQQKLVEVGFDLQQTEVTWVQNFLNDHLKDRTLEDVRALVRTELTDAETLRDLLKTQALELLQRVLPAPEMKFSAFGTANLVSQPEFTDVDRLRAVLKAVEEKATLLKLLERVLAESDVRVVLSSEHAAREVPELACVGASLSGHEVAIGLIGPSRMDYGRLVPMVRYATELFGRYWSRI